MPDAPGILGGEQVTLRDPLRTSVARLRYDTMECTASIVANDVLITAAHCVDPYFTGRGVEARYLSAEFGNAGNANAPKIQVLTFEIHPEWQETVRRIGEQPADQGDVALVKLAAPVPSGYHPLPLARTRDRLNPGDEVVIAGFGRSRRYGGGALRKATARILGPRGRWEIKIDQSAGIGICHGDSGGPGLLREADGSYVLWGVASRVFEPSCGVYGVMGLVPAYLDWIESTLAQL